MPRGAAVAGTASGNEVADMFKNEFVRGVHASFGQWIVAAAVAGESCILLRAGPWLSGSPCAPGKRRPALEHR